MSTNESMCGEELLTHSLVVFWDKKKDYRMIMSQLILLGGEQSRLLSFPELTLRSNCIKVSDLVDETEAIGLNDLILRRVLDMVTCLTVWISALNW